MSRLLAEITLRSPTGEPVLLCVTERSSYTTLPTDPAPGRWYRPLAERLGNYECSLFAGSRTAGGSRVGRGEVSLRNGDRWLDQYEDHAWEGIRILSGPAGRYVPYAAFSEVYQADITAARYEAGRVSLGFAELAERWDAEIPRRAYAGGNAGPVGLDGGPELATKLAPWGLGPARNVGVEWVNTSLHIAQAHDGALARLAVRERGQLLDSDGDVGAAITDPGLSITAGRYVTDLTRGLVRFGFAPQRPVTADVVPAGGNAAADHLARLASQLGLGSQVDAALLAPLAALAPWPVGWRPEGTATVLAMADKVMESVGGWWVVAPDGRVRAGLVAPPEAGAAAPDLAVTEADRDVTVERVDSTDDWGGLPVWRVEVLYDRCWTVMGDGDLFASVTGTERAGLMRAWPEPAVAEDPLVLAMWPKAAVLKVETGLVSQAHAQALADRLLAVHGVWRRRLAIRLPARLSPGRLPLGGTLYAARGEYGLSAGRRLLVTGLSTEDGRTYRVRAFG